MTKTQKAERADAITKLREWIKPGDTVHTILDHVSSSGMTRHIRVVLLSCEDGKPVDLHPNYSVARALDLRQAKRGDGLIVGGCGMDMGFHLVNSLSYALYGDGYKCLGKGKCPSNYHSNHRDQVRCEGTLVHNPDGPNFGQRCYAPGGLFSRLDIPAGWPRRQVDIGDGETVDASPLSCLTWEGADAPADALRLTDDCAVKVCPTCHGEGYVPNPEGPERFDLVHVDGYALRHRWL